MYVESILSMIQILDLASQPEQELIDLSFTTWVLALIVQVQTCDELYPLFIVCQEVSPVVTRVTRLL